MSAAYRSTKPKTITYKPTPATSDNEPATTLPFVSHIDHIPTSRIECGSICLKCGVANLHIGINLDGKQGLYTEGHCVHICAPQFDGPEHEDGPDSEGFKGPPPYNNFQPLNTSLTPAQTSLYSLEKAIEELPEWERKEVLETKEALDRLVLRYSSSAKLAIMVVCLQISISEGQ